MIEPDYRRRNKSAQDKSAQTEARSNKTAQNKTAPTKPRNIKNHVKSAHDISAQQ